MSSTGSLTIQAGTILVMQDGKREDSNRRQPLRLPVIAPKDDHSSSASSSRSAQRSGAGSAIPPRSRLPPRSRSGCWTCRLRKVKCDERRPICGQCVRLGHGCDYSPRLAFRDDTPRVLERMQDVTVPGSVVWDPTSPTSTDVSTGSGIGDDLPPFASLLTDEDRERKAEGASPGTYHVVVNPESFQNIPDFNEQVEIKTEGASPLRRGSFALSLSGSLERETIMEGIPVHGDPNVVILPRFDDLTRRTTTGAKGPRSPVLPVSRQPPTKAEEGLPSDALAAQPEADALPDARYFQHFRDVVWKQIVPAELDEGDDHTVHPTSFALLTSQAFEFPPLFHAIEALSALSLAQQDEKERLCAMQHYQQAISTLPGSVKSDEDLYSDGAFLTHFLMLVYEIAAAEVAHSGMWLHHLSTLLRISLQRREAFGGEAYAFVVWYVIKIDLEALFAGAGSGDYVAYLLQHDMIPLPDCHLFPSGVDGRSVILPAEHQVLPTVLQLNYDVTVLAIRLALLAKEYRSEPSDMQQKEAGISWRQGRIYELQEALRQLWADPDVMMIEQQMQHLPLRAKQIFEHAWTLYRACIIYSYTSMWPSQCLETSSSFEMEISIATEQILQISQTMISAGCVQCRYLLFPIFMAGLATTDGHQKMLALELVQKMAENRVGRNTTIVEKALRTIYETQNQHFMQNGHSLDVDWLEVMKQHGLLVVNFGL